MKSNLSGEERTALIELRKDKDIRIVQADKGNTTVVLDAEDYISKSQELLSDEKSYKKLVKDPTRTTERKLITTLRTMKNKGTINEQFYDQVKPSEGSSKPALFYGGIKLHKPNLRLRPVISTCRTATFNIARKLSEILRPLIKSSDRILRNTNDLIETMQDVVLQHDQILVSNDVKSLFTNIPVNESINICKRRLQHIHSHTSSPHNNAFCSAKKQPFG